MFGGSIGVFIGQMFVGHMPENAFTAQKLLQSVGSRPFSGRLFRLFMHTAPVHFCYGAATILAYSFITEFIRHHDETNLRPRFYDH